MRLWSISPKYLDGKGLVALWRETLLAKHVILGLTKGYKNHPQLIRFKKSENPELSINSYLLTIFNESKVRGYNFNIEKIGPTDSTIQLNVNSEQIVYEFEHLQRKLKDRDPIRYQENKNTKEIANNDFFKIIPGAIESWEII